MKGVSGGGNVLILSGKDMGAHASLKFSELHT